jgi:hypothetical protein
MGRLDSADCITPNVAFSVVVSRSTPPSLLVVLRHHDAPFSAKNQGESSMSFPFPQESRLLRKVAAVMTDGRI